MFFTLAEILKQLLSSVMSPKTHCKQKMDMKNIKVSLTANFHKLWVTTRRKCDF